MATTRVERVIFFIGLSTDELPSLKPSDAGSFVFLTDTEAYKVWNGAAWSDSAVGPVQ